MMSIKMKRISWPVLLLIFALLQATWAVALSSVNQGSQRDTESCIPYLVMFLPK